MRRAWLALMLLAAGASAEPARADPARFHWRGRECAGGAALFEGRLSELVEPRDRQRLTGSVAVTKSPGHYRVELSVDLDGRPLGTRRFDANSCGRAAETAAVAAALAVYEGEGEPEGVAESGISPEIWTRRPEPTPDFSRPRPAPKPKPLPLLEARLGLFGQLEVGALPKPAWGGALQLELGLGKRWSFAVLGGLSAAQERTVRAPQSVQLSLLSGAARACGAPLLGARLRLEGCAGIRLTQARGRGEGFDVSRTASLTWLAPLLGVNFSVRGPSYLEWRGELDGAVPLARRRFLVDGNEVARSAAVVAAARLGVVLRLR